METTVTSSSSVLKKTHATPPATYTHQVVQTFGLIFAVLFQTVFQVAAAHYYEREEFKRYWEAQKQRLSPFPRSVSKKNSVVSQDIMVPPTTTGGDGGGGGGTADKLNLRRIMESPNLLKIFEEFLTELSVENLAFLQDTEAWMKRCVFLN
jgi:hypothetical protein